MVLGWGHLLGQTTLSKKLISSGLIVSGMTLLSRILGMLRDAVIANLAGAGAAADLFLFAFRIPNFLRRLFAEGAFSQAFVPVLTEYQQRGDLTEVRRLIGGVSGTLGGIVTVVTLLAVVFSPLVVMLFGFGWFLDWLRGGSVGFKYLLASDLLRLTFPYLWFITFVALSGAILNTLGKFAVTAFTPVLLNASMIGCALWLAPKLEHPEIGLAVGVFLGGILQFLLQIPFLRRSGVLVWPRWAWHEEGVAKIRRLMLPALFGVSVNQINLLLDTVIANFMVPGTISWLYYADRLLEFPLGIFGVALSTVLLPTLARQHAVTASRSFSDTLQWGLCMAFLFGIPATLGLAVLAEPILAVVYWRGKFTIEDLHATANVLQAFNLGMISLMVSKVLATGYYARHDTRTPVRYGLITMVSNMFFNLLVLKFNYLGIPLASSLSSTLNAILLFRGLAGDGLFLGTKIGRFLLRVVLASLGMAVVIGHFSPALEQWLLQPILIRSYWLVATVVTGTVLYGALLLLLGVRWSHLHGSQSRNV